MTIMAALPEARMKAKLRTQYIRIIRMNVITPQLKQVVAYSTCDLYINYIQRYFIHDEVRTFFRDLYRFGVKQSDI